jgi:hypothetical protein
MEKESNMKRYMAVMFATGFSISLCAQVAYSEPLVELDACELGEFSEQMECEDGLIWELSAAENVLEAESSAESVLEAESSAETAGFPSWSCRGGYTQRGARLCMTGRRGPHSYANAAALCRHIRGRVANYEDWRYAILFDTYTSQAPVGWWLGPITADNKALYVNLPRPGDFDGEANRFGSRYYACAHDVF